MGLWQLFQDNQIPIPITLDTPDPAPQRNPPPYPRQLVNRIDQHTRPINTHKDPPIVDINFAYGHIIQLNKSLHTKIEETHGKHRIFPSVLAHGHQKEGFLVDEGGVEVQDCGRLGKLV